MPDGTPDAHAFQQTAHESDVLVGPGDRPVREGDLSGCGEQEFPYEVRRGIGVRQGHVGGDGAGEFQGAALPGP